MPTFDTFIKYALTDTKILLCIIPVLAMIIVNGWTDAPVTIAAAVHTKAISPTRAILLSAVCNFSGGAMMLSLGNTVAVSVLSVSGLKNIGSAALPAVIAAAITVVIWSSVALYFGLPTSESHALMSGLSGAGTALVGLSAFNLAEWGKVFLGLIISTVPVAVLSFYSAQLISRRLSLLPPTFKKLQILGAALSSFSHGAQDGQKFAGVLTVVAAMCIRKNDTAVFIPFWTVTVSSVLISFGTLLGGRKILSSISEFAPNTPAKGFASDLCSSIALSVLSVLGIPAGTTAAKTMAVLGAGFDPKKRIENGKIYSMLAAWLLTFPVCGLLGYFLTVILLFMFSVC